MAKQRSAGFSRGDEVTWRSHGGRAVGKVLRVITGRTRAGGREVAASADEPQVLVRSESGSGEAVHKPSALSKATRADRERVAETKKKRAKGR
jgi:hypothetical protein